MSQDTVTSASQDVVNDLAALRADLAKLSGLVVDLAKSQAEAARTGARETLAGAADRWHDTKHAAQARAADLSDRVRHPTPHLAATVSRDPLPSLLLALAGGFALGMMTGRRS